MGQDSKGATIASYMTPITVALVGIIGTYFINDRQTRDTGVRVYAELMSRREESDSLLRKDMFRSIIETFFSGKPVKLDQQILDLELLAYNFHETLDLGPLFKQVNRDIRATPGADKQYADRLEKVAREVTFKEMRVLTEASEPWIASIDFEELDKHPEGIRLFERNHTLRSEGSNPQPRRFTVEVLDRNVDRREVRLRLKVSAPGDPAKTEVDVVFWVGFFSFPMIDNTRLSRGQRCAIVLNSMEETFAQVSLGYFPGSRASLKEKPYYDEVMSELLKTR